MPKKVSVPPWQPRGDSRQTDTPALRRRRIETRYPEKKVSSFPPKKVSLFALYCRAARKFRKSVSVPFPPPSKIGSGSATNKSIEFKILAQTLERLCSALKTFVIVKLKTVDAIFSFHTFAIGILPHLYL